MTGSTALLLIGLLCWMLGGLFAFGMGILNERIRIGSHIRGMIESAKTAEELLLIRSMIDIIHKRRPHNG